MSTNLLELRDAAAQAGERIYREQLTSFGPEEFGRLIAIHIPTHELFFGATVLEAVNELRRKHPDASQGEVYTRRVGERGAIYDAHTPRVLIPK